MKVVALLAWFNEDARWLDATVRSLDGLCDHIVALDGAYELFPDTRHRSSDGERDAILNAAEAVGITGSVTRPNHKWQGNEVEKRTRLFQLAEEYTDRFDWYFVIDADEIVEAGHATTRQLLHDTPFDVAQATILEPQKDTQVKEYPLPMFFRAIRGLHCAVNHFTYRTPDGRYLWGNASTQRLEPREPVPLTVLHRTFERKPPRFNAARTYYRNREDAQVELGQCARCPRTATKTVPTNYRMGEHGGLVGEFIEVCPLCAKVIRQENTIRCRAWGVNPDAMQVGAGPARAA